MKLSKDLGIDLGTANILIYASGKGIVTREPAVVAIDKTSGKLLQSGAEARMMLGRTPGNVAAVRPMRNGVVSDYELTVKMLREFLHRIDRFALVKPRVVISVPSSISEMEERAVIQAALEAGARRAYLIEEPLAAALGAGLDISGPSGHMVVDIGGGTTDVAVLSLSGVVKSEYLTILGQTAPGDGICLADYPVTISCENAIIRYLRRRYNVLVGAQTAETIKMTIGCVYERPETATMIAKGRDLKSGLPREVELRSEEMIQALRQDSQQIIDTVLSVLEDTPPELVNDIAESGIVLTGGGSLIWGMDRLVEEATGIVCSVADDAESCVALGIGKSLNWVGQMQEGTINLARKKLLSE